MSDHPTFSILTPVWNTDPEVLRETIESVRNQSYPRWQLVLVDDASSRADTIEVLDHYSWIDARIRVRHREVNGGISAATNDALAMATGSHVGLLDHDDLLHPDALGAVGHLLHSEPDLDLIYTDEDKIDMEGNRFGEYFKPGWSPELLFGQMVTGHFTVYRTSIVAEVGGFRPECMGSQDWDLALRITERTTRIRHIPRVLYHWRQVPGSTSIDVQSKPYTITAARQALTDSLARRGTPGSVEDSYIAGHFHVRLELLRTPTVSVLLPTAGTSKDVRGREVKLVDQCLAALAERTDYPSIEVIVPCTPGMAPEEVARLRSSAPLPITLLEQSGSWSFSRSINHAASHATGELLLLLNDDVDPVESDWLTRLVEWLQDDGIGCVGPKLLFEDGSIQHAGIVGVHGSPVHNARRWEEGPGYFGELILTKNYLALTGACLLTRRKDFFEVGGLSDDFPVNFNDIDYCLKLYERGFRHVFEPRSVLYHYESASRTPTVAIDEMALFTHRWGHIMGNDPYFTKPHSELMFPQPFAAR